MEETTKLEPFLLLAKSAKGKAAADLISKATADPSIFAFGELLDVPAIRELQGTELDSAYRLLELFCYGTWTDLKDQQKTSLTQQQQLKLKQLTVVSLAAQAKEILYTELMTHLEIQNVRELEDLIISECFYPGLLKGKLDQKQRCLHIHEAIARDVKREDIPALVSGLGNWQQISQDLLAHLQNSMGFVQGATESAKKAQEDMEATIEAERKKFKAVDKEGEMMMEETGTLEMMDVEDRSLPSGVQQAGSRSKRRR